MASWIIQRKNLLLWAILTAALAAWLSHVLLRAEDKTPLLPGITTDGHYQIEMDCAACHTDEKVENVFTNSGVTNKGCMNCHGEDLDEFNDSHPVRKFKNPENAVFLQHIDAMRCVTCHQEHNHKVTGEMAVTVPADYCAHCHETTLENIESHRNLPYNTCATSGCHNYHDNIPLAPSFLRRNYGQPKNLPTQLVAESETLKRWIEEGNNERPALAIAAADAPPAYSNDPKITHDWHASAHAAAGINCSDCHNDPQTGAWQEKPTYNSCMMCHETEVTDFKKGKHGMRLAHEGLSPMTPDMARSEMHTSAAHNSLSCNSCHTSHRYDRQYAAYQACVQCHNSEHTKNYENSRHFQLWQNELSGVGAKNSGVSCATCHMPREDRRNNGIVVNHNQSSNLKPNEKMLRNVCMDCHGVQFSMNALADEKLIDANFAHHPTVNHEGISWVVESAIKRGDEKVIEIHKKLTEPSSPAGSTPPALDDPEKSESEEQTPNIKDTYE